MRRHLKVWLNGERLAAMGGVYEGAVVDVVEEEVRNKVKAVRETVPVILFADGQRLIPNQTMRVALVDALGPDTDAWRGRRLRIEHRRIAYPNGKSATMKTATVVDLARSTPAPAPAPPPPLPAGPLRPNAIERSDYDDSPAALAEAKSTARANGKPAVMTADEVRW